MCSSTLELGNSAARTFVTVTPLSHVGAGSGVVSDSNSVVRQIKVSFASGVCIRLYSTLISVNQALSTGIKEQKPPRVVRKLMFQTLPCLRCAACSPATTLPRSPHLPNILPDAPLPPCVAWYLHPYPEADLVCTIAPCVKNQTQNSIPQTTNKAANQSATYHLCPLLPLFHRGFSTTANAFP